MIKMRIEKLEERITPVRLYAYSLWGIRRNLEQLAEDNKTDYVTELKAFLDACGHKINGDYRKAFEKELKDIQEHGLVRQLPFFQLTAKEIESETKQTIEMVQSRIDTKTTTLDEEIETICDFAYSTHPEVTLRVLAYFNVKISAQNAHRSS